MDPFNAGGWGGQPTAPGPGNYPTNDGDYRQPRPGMAQYQNGKGSSSHHHGASQRSNHYSSSRGGGGPGASMRDSGFDAFGNPAPKKGGGYKSSASVRSSRGSRRNDGEGGGGGGGNSQAVQMLLDRYPMYQIDFDVLNCGLRIVTSKRRLRWRFGFPNPEALEQGRQGSACRGQEHDVTVLWSVTSGKRLITADGQEVTQFTDRSGILEHSWRMYGNHIVKIVAHASPPLTKRPGFRQYQLYIDGRPFTKLPKVYELGQWGPGMPMPQMAPVGYAPHGQNGQHMTEEDIQNRIRKMMGQTSMNGPPPSVSMPTPAPPPMPAPAASYAFPSGPNPYPAPAPPPAPAGHPFDPTPVPAPAAPAPAPVPLSTSTELVPVGFVPCPVIDENEEDEVLQQIFPPCLQLTDGTPIEELDKRNAQMDMQYAQSQQPQQQQASDNQSIVLTDMSPPAPVPGQPEVQQFTVHSYGPPPPLQQPAQAQAEPTMVVEDIDDELIPVPNPDQKETMKNSILIEDIDDEVDTKQVVMQGLQQMKNQMGGQQPPPPQSNDLVLHAFNPGNAPAPPAPAPAPVQGSDLLGLF
mmetsp:Transcript_5108/g.6405  ORF Transcript_5108/g.6405 Transcript_5108/m.6405 type:complete len:578 (+) Transcript_5108:132-1865(+)